MRILHESHTTSDATIAHHNALAPHRNTRRATNIRDSSSGVFIGDVARNGTLTRHANPASAGRITT